MGLNISKIGLLENLWCDISGQLPPPPKSGTDYGHYTPAYKSKPINNDLFAFQLYITFEVITRT